MALLVKIHLKGSCCWYSFKRSLRKEGTPGHFLSMRITYPMLIGALKLFLHSTHFTKSSNQITDLLQIIEAEKEKDSYQLPRTFSSEKLKMSFIIKKSSNRIQTANPNKNSTVAWQGSLTVKLKVISKKNARCQKWELNVNKR